MGLLDGIFGGGMKDPVRGSAQVVSATGYHGRGIYQSCTMQIVVQAEGVPATAVKFDGLVHNKRWPRAGMVLPVTVDRADPQNVKIEWDEVEHSGERAAASAEQLAAAMRGEAPAGGGIPGAQVINLSGGDLSQLSEEQKAKLRMLGLLPPGAGPAPPPAEEASDDEAVDDRLDQLERLVKLRDQGVLTDEEFAEQKRQILG